MTDTMAMPYDTATPATPYDHLLTLKQYAEHHGVHPRTVKRWLSEDELPGSRQDPADGHWLIPINAARTPKVSAPAGILVTTESGARPIAPVRDIPPAAPATVTQAPTSLDTMATMIPIDTASQILGVSAHAIAKNAEYYRAVKHGRNGGWVVPMRRIKKLRGLI